MDQQALVISVRLLDDRYHGSGSWPPSPFRLFQALVAAAYTGCNASENEVVALRWLEQLPPPIVLSPKHKKSNRTTYYVPRNGADAQQGNLEAAAKKRDAKYVEPWLFDAQQPLHYVWFFDEPTAEADTLIQLSENLYQLGRGIDMAFAWAEQLAADEAQQIIVQHAGPVFRPTPQGVSSTLDCPSPSQSFDSLTTRYQGQLKRLLNGEFHKPPLPVFQPTGYNCPSSLLLFEIQNSEGNLLAQPFTAIAQLTQSLVEIAKDRLKPHFPEYTERYLAGVKANQADKALRVRVIPLPSIGNEHTQPDIRRVLIEIPIDCPLQLADVEWAFSGLTLEVDLETGEIGGMLVKATDANMLNHYGVNKQTAARIWRTVTPVALPIDRIDQAKTGADRVLKQNQLHHAARQALRHSGITAPVKVRRIQREPFTANGTLAERFAFQRFDRTRLYHLELEFTDAISGLIVIGDGRYQGLGLMSPVQQTGSDIFRFRLYPDNRPAVKDRVAFLNAVRNALMSLARQTLNRPGRLFSGHEADGSVARSGKHEHLFLAADDGDGDGLLDELLVVAPWAADRSLTAFEASKKSFQQVIKKLELVRAGALGVFGFEMVDTDIDAVDKLLGMSKHWKTVSSYQPTRFPKSLNEASDDIELDVQTECQRRHLPKPQVEILKIKQAAKGAFRAHIRLTFSVTVSGPIILGRDSHHGGGLFEIDQLNNK